MSPKLDRVTRQAPLPEIRETTRAPVVKSVRKPARPVVTDAFLQRLYADSIPMLQLAARKWDSSNRRSRPPAPFDYLHYVLEKSIAVTDSLDRMYRAADMVGCAPSTRRRLRRFASFRTWREYHCYVFLSSAVGLHDTNLILTNAVFELGIQERRCDRDSVIDNAWLSGTPARIALKQLDVLVRPLRSHRHPMVHRGEMPDLTGGLGEDVELNVTVVDHGLLTNDKLRPVEDRRPDVSRKLARDWAAETDRLRIATNTLFDALLPVYERHMRSRPSSASALPALCDHMGFPRELMGSLQQPR